jgi:hypothetical protein
MANLYVTITEEITLPNNNVEKIDSIETSLIISEYRKDYKLDVSRYFRNLEGYIYPKIAYLALAGQINN